MRAIVVISAALSVAGCAVGNKHVYDVGPEFSLRGVRTVAVAAQDMRSYVLSGEKDPRYVGTQRGGFGNPFNITTRSGRPLAEDFGTAVASSLSRGGFKAVALAVPASGTRADARALASRAGADRVALIEIADWKSSTYQNTGLEYDVTLRVLDASGKEIASNRVSGRDDLGGSAWNPPAHARQAVPEAYRKKVEQLFASQAVGEALR